MSVRALVPALVALLTVAGCATSQEATGVAHRTLHFSDPVVSMAVDESEAFAFVGLAEKGIAVIDIKSGATIRTVELDGLPTLIQPARGAAGSAVYVLISRGSREDGEIAKFDHVTARVLERKTVRKAFFPVGAALSADGGRLFVTDANSPILTVFDTATLETVQRIGLPAGGFGLAMVSDSTRMLVSHAFEGSVSAVHIEQGRLKSIDTVKGVGLRPVHVAVSPNGEDAGIYIIDNGTSTVNLVGRGGRVLESIALKFWGQPVGELEGFLPHAGGVFMDSGRQLRVWSPTVARIVDIDVATRRVTSFIPLEKEPRFVVIAPTSGIVLVADRSGHVLVIERKRGSGPMP